VTAAEAAPPTAGSMKLRAVALAAGRGLIALLFVLAGLAKLVGPGPFLAHMAEYGVPGLLIWGVAALEIGGGLAVLLGWRLRWTAGALALFCVATALIFHLNLADKVERTSFLKDLAIAGGLLALAASAQPRPLAPQS
jgi:putative oxidoreductase